MQPSLCAISLSLFLELCLRLCGLHAAACQHCGYPCCHEEFPSINATWDCAELLAHCPWNNFLLYEVFLNCITLGVYFLPLCWNVSGWCCWDVGSCYCLPQELLRAVHLMAGDNCCVRKHFLCPSRTLRLHPEIQNRGVWDSWKNLIKSTWLVLLLLR